MKTIKNEHIKNIHNNTIPLGVKQIISVFLTFVVVFMCGMFAGIETEKLHYEYQKTMNINYPVPQIWKVECKDKEFEKNTLALGFIDGLASYNHVLKSAFENNMPWIATDPKSCTRYIHMAINVNDLGLNESDIEKAVKKMEKKLRPIEEGENRG